MEKLNANLHISNDSLKEYQKELYAKIFKRKVRSKVTFHGLP